MGFGVWGVRSWELGVKQKNLFFLVENIEK